MLENNITYEKAKLTDLNEILSMYKERSQWFKEKGIDSIEGKTTKEIMELLSSFMHDYFTGLDDTAAREHARKR